MRSSFYFVELCVDELLDRVECRALVFAVRFYANARAAPRGEQQDAEDGFAVDFLIAFADLDVGLEARRYVHELRRGACVQSEFVLDLDVALGHPTLPARARSAERRA